MIDMLSETKSFIVSIGIEALKEKGEVAYNERKIKDELTDYTNREYINFENIDRNCEIDFENLRVYIIEELIEEFRESLFGDINKRERTKESIIERLYAYVQANSLEKKQYVEKIFSNAYTIIQNYYETYMIKHSDLYLAKKVVDDIHEDIKQQNIELVESLSKNISFVQNQQPDTLMVQYSDKSQQIGQVGNLIINND